MLALTIAVLGFSNWQPPESIQDKKPNDEAAVRRLFQGKWRVVAYSRDGAFTPTRVIVGQTYEFNEDEVEMRFGSNRLSKQSVRFLARNEDGSFSLDINSVQSMAKLDGELLIVATASKGNPRPTELNPKGAGVHDYTVMVRERN